ncbi:MAG TPA: phosphotransferase system, HPr-related protein, partial [Pseudomonas sp.]|nr:phosphotransferase system, HPr-related protein [Pseudomonas sp.]
ADQQLRRVDSDEIGGGIGLDEAELARSAPLDGKPWTDRVSPPEGDEEA